MEGQAAHEKKCEEYNAKQRRLQYSTVEVLHKKRKEFEKTYELALALCP
jgi:hypothetical protein